jgi:hypothetical protein
MRSDVRRPAVQSAKANGAAIDTAAVERRSAGRPGSERHTGLALLEKTIDKLEDLIDEETSALKTNRAIDLREYNNRKSQTLLELTRLTRMVGPATVDAEFKGRLELIRGKLDTNRGVIQMHLDAVREIAALVQGSIQEAESDGTYSPHMRKATKIR